MMIGNYSDCGLKMIEIMFKGNTLLTTAYFKSELQHFNGPAIFRGSRNMDVTRTSSRRKSCIVFII